ncbi:MAG: nuclease [Rhodoferax sp.]|nr:nuclease [Rhodoferax sp.]
MILPLRRVDAGFSAIVFDEHPYLQLRNPVPMARLIPSLPPRAALSAGAYAELALLHTLEQGLSSAYSLFHSVDWSRGVGEQEQHGEIDIVVANQAGDVLLIEVKSGAVDFAPDGIFKSYRGTSKSVSGQIGLQYGALRGRLQDEGLSVQLHHLLVLPDVQVRTQSVQWPRERIVDSTDMPHITTRIAQALGPGLPQARMQPRVLAFFENRFQVVPDVSALAGRLQQDATRLSAGLATWVTRMQVPSGLVRVVGTAGSGKTQLALRLLRDADAAGQKHAYLCFNRALADHMAQVAPVRTSAETFHEYAVNLLRAAGEPVDFAVPGAFDRIASRAIALLEGRQADLDLLVLDEVQDLQAEWVQALLGRVRADGRAYLLEDPDQQLYKDREGFDLPEAVTVTSHENFRSPRALVKLINALRLTRTEIEALGPHPGEVPDPIVFERPEGVQPCTIQAVERCLARGFALEDMAVISLRGRERSLLQGLDSLGPWTLRRFTGAFDAGGGAIWTPGELLVESLRRFKGQAAAAVVLTECDFAELDALTQRLLFVGLTRARVHLEWVVSASAAACVAERLGAA